MFGVFAKTLFRASGVDTPRISRDAARSWYREDQHVDRAPKRWEDWK